MIKIGKRPLSEVIKRVFKKNLFKVIKNFLSFIKTQSKQCMKSFLQRVNIQN